MKKLICIVFSTLLSIAAVSQEQSSNKDDVKVGLVLSGGGAKGLAHIGVLKVIEEAGVRIDYIGGTSMGAIIGALYASGYSAKEMDSIFKVVDFSQLIQDNLPREARTFYEKEDAEKYALTLPFDGFKISFPTSLSKGQNVYNLMYKLTEHVSQINDFSKLPIPFFCMATDVETGKAVQLDKGYLPQAISASGALPSLFGPVEINGQLLIDGGVTNNYPIDEVRRMGADIIIGVDVQDSLVSRENLRSAIDVLVQINNYRTINEMHVKREKTDIYIHPNIKDFSVISFNKGDDIIEAGRQEALLFKENLELLASKQNHLEKIPVKKIISDSLHIDEILISGNKEYTRSYILGKLKLKTPTIVSYKKFNEGINNLAATANFNQINYNFSENEFDQKVLNIELQESKTRNFLRFGLHFDDLYKSAALINFTRKRLFQKNDIASFDFILGDNLRYNFEYYIDKGYYWSFGAKSRYNIFKKNVRFSLFPSEIVEGISSVTNIEVKNEDITNQIYVQTLFKQISLLGLGVEHKHLKLQSITLGDSIQNKATVFEDTNYFSAFGNLKLDNLDNKYFPKNGVFFEGNFNFYVLASGLNKSFDRFSIARAFLGYAFTPFNNISIYASTEGGFKIGGENTSTLDFFVGGYGYKPFNNFIHFFGYDAFELRGDTYLKSTLRLNYQIFKKSYISGVVNIANVGDKLFTTSQWIDGIDYSGYALGCATETIIGPLEVFYSYSPERKQNEWYVSLGFWF